MSVVFVLAAVATASVNVGGNPEVNANPTDTNYCDPYQRALGLCKSTSDLSGDY